MSLDAAADRGKCLARDRTGEDGFPDVIVGDIEPVPAAEAPTDWVKRYSAWLDAWHELSGAPLPFFHLDVNWSVLWLPDVEAMRHELVSRRIPFGIIYNGYWEDITDADWVRDTITHFTRYETLTSVTPDDVVFQTWDKHPTRALPETSPAAMTHEVDATSDRAPAYRSRPSGRGRLANCGTGKLTSRSAAPR